MDTGLEANESGQRTMPMTLQLLEKGQRIRKSVLFLGGREEVTHNKPKEIWTKKLCGHPMECFGLLKPYDITKS